MSLFRFTEWLQNTAGSTAFRESILVYPLVETTHVLTLTLFLGVIAMMPIVGMTINFISTIAFVIVLGMLVDDAVVVAEKILLRRQDGLSPRDAAVSGTVMVARPVIASAVTTLLAFPPMLAIGGMASKIIWQIPAVVCIALGISLLESFLILPAHMSMIRGDSRPRRSDRPGHRNLGRVRAFLRQPRSTDRSADPGAGGGGRRIPRPQQPGDAERRRS